MDWSTIVNGLAVLAIAAIAGVVWRAVNGYRGRIVQLEHARAADKAEDDRKLQEFQGDLNRALEARFKQVEDTVQAMREELVANGQMIEGHRLPASPVFPRAEPNAQDRRGAYPLGDLRNAQATWQSTLERLSQPF